MGRQRKTLGEHLRGGTFRWDRNGDQAASASRPVTPLAKPSDLRGPAGKLWDTLASELSGVISATDGPALGMLCRLMVEWQRAERSLRKLKPETPEYARLVRAMGNLTADLDKFLVRFGLTPVDRERLPPPTGEGTRGPLGARTW